MDFQSSFLEISSGRKWHISSLAASSSGNESTPLILLHGLGSSTSYWEPMLLSAEGKKIAQGRRVISLDLDGHGLSPFSGEERGILGYVQDLKSALDALGLKKVLLVGHSMSGMITTVFAAKHPSYVERLYLLSPVVQMQDVGRKGMQDRARNVLSLEGQAGVANTVSQTGISKRSLEQNPMASAYIRNLVIRTNPQAYAVACKALATSDGWTPSEIKCAVTFNTGSDDYMANGQVVKKWAAELEKGKAEVMEGVGHWGALEVPEQVARSIAAWLDEA